MVIGFSMVWLALPAAWAQDDSMQSIQPVQSMLITDAQAATPATASEANAGMTSEEILALFQREARAAYQMNQDACEGLSTQEKKICLARARLQFDADMRYAQKRADQGY